MEEHLVESLVVARACALDAAARPPDYIQMRVNHTVMRCRWCVCIGDFLLSTLLDKWG